MLEILYQDSYLIAINKPHGLLVHKTGIAGDAKEFAVQLLRDQIHQRVYPVHRLDRKTSGVLLFALDEKTNSLMQMQFQERETNKKYVAIVRGHTPDEGVIDYPLTNEREQVQDAITYYKTIERVELPIALGKHETSRYSLVEVNPQTGRYHQIRKHFAHIFYPIIGDRPHGCNKQNKLFKERWNINSMMLHAKELTFEHPINHNIIAIKADFQREFSEALQILSFNK